MKLIKFYEVCDQQDNAVWGGTSTIEALEWFRRALDRKVYVSVWNEDDPEEPRLVTDKIEVTPIMRTCLAFTLDDRFNPRPSKPWDDMKVKY
jgi:hypothetical protein